MTMPKILLEITPELNRAIRKACQLEADKLGRTSVAVNPFIEQVLRRNQTIRRAAGMIGVELPNRPIEGRGKYER